MGRLLEVESLRVTFRQKDGDAYAVRDVSLALDEGGSLGIVGESGSGKSVTSMALMGLLASPPAEIRMERMNFDGAAITDLSRRGLRGIRGRGMAMVFQEPMTSLDPVFTVGSQLVETLLVHLKVSKKEAGAMSESLLARVEIPDPAAVMRAFPHQLSGGMRQRVMIAMAVSCGPKLLIADEPTTALDVTIQAQVLELIKTLQSERGMALMMITHDLGVIAETVDRVAVMYGGFVMETAEVGDLFASPAHPYTRALLGSIPRTDADAKDALVAIPGGSPIPTNPPGGCPFHPRCAEAQPRCAKDMPSTTILGTTRSARCWRIA
jgi:oligopeptide/dipeptide ABC transporter ATP-binding protein